MKCPSVAGVWPASASPSPPSHRITAAAVLPHPAALYTGGSDGPILLWALFPNEIRPLAVLCGHASAIADLAACRPTVETPNLISVCTDGVLCVWSLRTGLCRRRRRLPLRDGSPASLSPLPSSPRDVCVACSESPEGIWCAVVIVDSYTLNVVRTVLHGSLAIGPIKSLALGEEDLNIFDRQGRAQLLKLSKDTDAAAAVLIWGETFNDEVQAVVVSGELVAFVLRA